VNIVSIQIRDFKWAATAAVWHSMQVEKDLQWSGVG